MSPFVLLVALNIRRPAVMVLALSRLHPVSFGLKYSLSSGPVELANLSSYDKRSTVLHISTPQRVLERRTENWRTIVVVRRVTAPFDQTDRRRMVAHIRFGCLIGMRNTPASVPVVDPSIARRLPPLGPTRA